MSMEIKILKKNHHLKVTEENASGSKVWEMFLNDQQIYARTFMDFDDKSEELDWYTDSSANPELGTGGYTGTNWFILQWNEQFMINASPSRNYLELYGVTVAVFLWINKFRNKNVTIFCDNMSVVQMVNNTSSKCKNCMILIRMMVLKMMENNTKITAKHVLGEQNKFADHLSRMRYKEFRALARKQGKKFNNKPDPIPDELWPMEKIFLFNRKGNKT